MILLHSFHRTGRNKYKNEFHINRDYPGFFVSMLIEC